MMSRLRASAVHRATPCLRWTMRWRPVADAHAVRAGRVGRGGARARALDDGVAVRARAIMLPRGRVEAAAARTSATSRVIFHGQDARAHGVASARRMTTRLARGARARVELMSSHAARTPTAVAGSARRRRLPRKEQRAGDARARRNARRASRAPEDAGASRRGSTASARLAARARARCGARARAPPQRGNEPAVRCASRARICGAIRHVAALRSGARALAP